MRSRLKCAIFSNNKKSSNTTGPRGPTVKEFWLSPTGRPASVVILWFSGFILFSDIVAPSPGRVRRGDLYIQYIVHIEWIGIAYRTAKWNSTSCVTFALSLRAADSAVRHA